MLADARSSFIGKINTSLIQGNDGFFVVTANSLCEIPSAVVDNSASAVHVCALKVDSAWEAGFPSIGRRGWAPLMKSILSGVFTREDVRGHESGRREHCR